MDFYYPELDQRVSDDCAPPHNGFASGLDDEEAAKFFSSIRYGDFAASLYLGDRHKQIPTASFDALFNDPRTRTDDARGYLELSYQHAFSSDQHATRT